MNALARLLIVGCATCSTPVFAQQAHIAHFEDVLDWQVAASAADSAAIVAAGFAAFGRRFDLALEANHRVQAMSAPGMRAYRGSLRGFPDSWARIVMTGNGPAGMIWDGATLYGVEPGADGTSTTIFRADDVVIPPGTMSCGIHAPPADAAEMFAELTTLSPQIARAAGASLNINLGVVGDSGFAALYADPAAAMLVRANNIDGIFSEQIGVQFSVEQIDVFADAQEDPFTATTDAETLLDELAVYRGNTPSQDAQGLTHLFTGRDLDGSTVGLAYLGAVCAQASTFDPEGRSYGAGLTQANRGSAGTLIESLIAAHEIGHNFGAPHDGEEGECLDVPPGFLMAPALSPSADQFSDCSIGVITENLASMDCLTPIPTVDLAVEGRRGSDTPYTDTPFDYFVEVTNQGLEPATDVTVQLELDAALEVLAVAPQAGTCTVTQHSVTCDPGEVPGTVTRTIRVNLQSNDPGERTITASLSATADVNAANDSFSDTIAVTSASDLALVTNPQILLLDEREVLSVSLENRSDTATGAITLTGSFSGGLRIDNADFSGTACTIAAEQRTLTCAFAGLAAFSSAAIDFELTGTQSGSQLLSLSVSAQQADPDTANNSASIALEVVTEATDPPEASGGGGSLGPLVVFALLGAWARRRRNTAKQKANFS